MKDSPERKRRLLEEFKTIEKEIRKEDNKHKTETDRLLAIKKNLIKTHFSPETDLSLYKKILKEDLEPVLHKFDMPMSDFNQK